MRISTVMFAKAPVPGRVKTRLAASIGNDLAAAFHAAFLHDLADTVASLDGRHVLAFAGDQKHSGFHPHRQHRFEFVEQPAGDLGERLDAIIRAEASDVDAVLVIGSDSPTLGVRHFRQAAERLEAGAQVVIGPSFDGGYYLIGVRTDWFQQHIPSQGPHPLFDDIAWSTRDVLGQTLRRCRHISALCDLTAFWYDVDDFQDLEFLRTHLLDHLTDRQLKSSGGGGASRTATLLRLSMDEGTLPQPGEGRIGDESE